MCHAIFLYGFWHYTTRAKKKKQNRYRRRERFVRDARFRVGVLRRRRKSRRLLREEKINNLRNHYTRHPGRRGSYREKTTVLFRHASHARKPLNGDGIVAVYFYYVSGARTFDKHIIADLGRVLSKLNTKKTSAALSSCPCIAYGGLLVIYEDITRAAIIKFSRANGMINYFRGRTGGRVNLSVVRDSFGPRKKRTPR